VHVTFNRTATAAGRNGNRTSFTDTKDGTLVTDVGYCYDWADRLTASVPTVAGGNPVLGAMSVAAGTIAYNSHGNTTVLADSRVISRTTDTLGDAFVGVTRRYTTGGAMNAVLNINNTVVQRTVMLPGGEQVALSTVRRHRIFSRFLADGATTTFSSAVGPDLRRTA